MKQKKLQKNQWGLAVMKAGFRLGWRLVIYVGWSLVLGMLMLPYLVIKLFTPRKDGGQPVSQFFRKAFESKKAKRIIGISLTGLMVLFGTMSNIWAAQEEIGEEAVLAVPEEVVITNTSLNKPLEGKISQRFSIYHQGVDILAPVGTVIKPIAVGKVKQIAFSGWGYGNTVLIEHKNGLSSRYAHLKNIYVGLNNSVDEETEIGTVGMSGWTTGPHLHLEIHQNGQAVNPLTVLPEFGINEIAMN